MLKVIKNYLIILILIVIIFSAIIATIHDSQSYFGDKSTKTTVAETAAPETTVPQITVAETKAEDLITIENVSCVLDGDYYYYKGTINNNSRRTVSYVKYDIFMYNDEKKIIQTDWSNWTGTLPPGACTSIDTMITYVPGSEKYRVVVDEVVFK